MTRRRKRINWPLFWAGAALLAVFAGFCLLWPVVASLQRVGKPDQTLIGLSLSEQIRTRCVAYFIGLWMFTFGATIGSFLNVVAYRMPRGESVVWRPSRCPFCETPIRSTDNIPVIGWLRLRGRCRACHLPISPRYPIIEFLMGALFLSFALADLFSGPMLDAARGPLRGGVAEIVLSARWDFAAVLAYQGCLAAILMSLALMRFDNQRPPGKLVVFAILVAMVAPAFFPALRPDAWEQFGAVGGAAVGRLETLPTGILGGLALGGIWHLALRNRTKGSRAQESDALAVPAIALAMVGAFFGWQACFSVFGLALVVQLVASAWTCQIKHCQIKHCHLKWPADASVLAGFYIHTLVWSVGEAIRWWPSQTMSAAGLVLYALLCACLLIAVRSVLLLKGSEPPGAL